MPWDITGNAGTDPSTNFLGTSDNEPLVVKTNGQLAMQFNVDGTPSAKVEIVGNWNGREGALRLTGDKPTLKFVGGPVAGNQSWILHLGSDGGGSLEFFKQGANPDSWENVMTLSPSGNVGIGTSNPSTKLKVIATAGAGTAVHCESQDFEGVRGVSHSAHGGVVGTNDGNGAGVFGVSDQNEGVHGETNSPTFAAVAGIMLNPSGTGAGVYGESRGQGPAGFFKGDIMVTGDIRLLNADCAEDFDLSETESIEPGTVMTLDQEGKLKQSEKAYDKRVAGVISGAGGYKPGIVLDKQASKINRVPIALLGKVFCKVDARYSPIEVGDLLTTSPTLGHAMKADDPLKAFGAVIGKALLPLPNGQGLVPILIALQ